jgi:hypothetical protein
MNHLIGKKGEPYEPFYPFRSFLLDLDISGITDEQILGASVKTKNRLNSQSVKKITNTKPLSLYRASEESDLKIDSNLFSEKEKIDILRSADSLRDSIDHYTELFRKGIMEGGGDLYQVVLRLLVLLVWYRRLISDSFEFKKEKLTTKIFCELAPFHYYKKPFEIILDGIAHRTISRDNLVYFMCFYDFAMRETNGPFAVHILSRKEFVTDMLAATFFPFKEGSPSPLLYLTSLEKKGGFPGINIMKLLMKFSGFARFSDHKDDLDQLYNGLVCIESDMSKVENANDLFLFADNNKFVVSILKELIKNGFLEKDPISSAQFFKQVGDLLSDSYRIKFKEDEFKAAILEELSKSDIGKATVSEFSKKLSG